MSSIGMLIIRIDSVLTESNYELALGQLEGKEHYNMRGVQQTESYRDIKEPKIADPQILENRRGNNTFGPHRKCLRIGHRIVLLIPKCKEIGICVPRMISASPTGS